MTFAAVLFDFSATLFDPTQVVDGAALAERARAHGAPLSAGAAQTLGERILAHASTRRGRRTRRRCDLSIENHRAGWTATARAVEGVSDSIAEAFHDCITDPSRWHPYPDTPATLHSLREAGVQVGVVSNCGWDIREAFRRTGLHRFVDAYVLSYEHGRVKPDPELFRRACVALDVAPSRTLMVGDDPRTDAGGIAAGLAVYILPPAPCTTGPRGLDRLRPASDPDGPGRALPR